MNNVFRYFQDNAYDNSICWAAYVSIQRGSREEDVVLGVIKDLIAQNKSLQDTIVTHYERCVSPVGIFNSKPKVEGY